MFWFSRSVALVCASLLTLPSTASAAIVVFSASGADSASIQSTVDSYRTALGALNPNVAGSFGSGRREINWDGVPDALAAPSTSAAFADGFGGDFARGVGREVIHFAARILCLTGTCERH